MLVFEDAAPAPGADALDLDPPPLDAWEESKENAQPRRKGRNVQKLSDALDSERRRGAGSESHRHAGLDVVVDSLVSDKLFEFVLRRRHGSDVGAAYFVRVAARCGGVVELERV